MCTGCKRSGCGSSSDHFFPLPPHPPPPLLFPAPVMLCCCAASRQALIWSKKSTGMPIEIKTAYCRDRQGMASHVSYCKLDIDIHKVGWGGPA